MKTNKPIYIIIIWTIIGVCYFPIFFASWLLHIIARLLLSISYFGLLNAQRGKDVFKSIFRFNPTLYT